MIGKTLGRCEITSQPVKGGTGEIFPLLLAALNHPAIAPAVRKEPAAQAGSFWRAVARA